MFQDSASFQEMKVVVEFLWQPRKLNTFCGCPYSQASKYWAYGLEDGSIRTA
ncbi:hypothetical protein L6252_03110 [Candidatus Parcubacteria bacterium]|nr:hypothetical protein [Candidatus Parcubacteria bacterium]